MKPYKNIVLALINKLFYNRFFWLFSTPKIGETKEYEFSESRKLKSKSSYHSFGQGMIYS